MTVYVDDMCDDALGQFGRMKMSHLIADTTEELLEMCRTIKVNVKWIQKAGTHKEHFDIAKGKRTAALVAGAVPITMKQASAMVGCRRMEGALGAPETALERYHALKVRVS